MKRLDRIKYTYNDLDLHFRKGRIGFNELIDNAVKELLRINDQEYDFMCGQMKEEEYAVISSEKLTYSQKRKLLEFRNKYILMFHQEDGIKPIGFHVAAGEENQKL